jgi:hypothetical protein
MALPARWGGAIIVGDATSGEEACGDGAGLECEEVIMGITFCHS